MGRPEKTTIHDPISRRTFLREYGLPAAKMIAGGVIGAAIAKDILPALSLAANKTVTDITGMPTGNQGMNTIIAERCGEKPTNKCIEEYYKDPLTKFMIAFVNPITEEFRYRWLAHLAKNIIGKQPNPIRDTLLGDDHLDFSVNSSLICFFSSLIFALDHNQDREGNYSMKTLPVSQFINGVIYSVLQNNFGFPISALTHGVYNDTVLKMVENK